MNRIIARARLHGRQRAIAINLVLGSSTILAYGTFRGYRPILADSDQYAGSWKSQPTVVSNNQTSPVRSDSDANFRKEQIEHSTKEEKPGLKSPPPPPPTKGHSVFDLEGDYYEDGLAAWQNATSRAASVAGSLTDIKFGDIRDKVTNAVVPSWARQLPNWLNKVQNELSMAPWSLSWEIWEEAHHPEINPEIIWDAEVRISNDLCAEEKSFLRKRQQHTTKALARYLDVPESEVHPDDVPIIAMCGSGGGLRALVAGASSFLCTQEDGLFDCVTYTAGVSGSCWLQTLYNSSIGHCDYTRVIEHLKQRIGVHIAYPPALFKLLSQAPTNKYLLSGFVEKLRGVPNADFGVVDIYGLALAARLLVPKGELRVDNHDLKVSNQRSFTDEGKAPLPIYTAVRHEIPNPTGKDLEELAKSSRFSQKHFDWFEWFEWSPYEFFSEDIGAGIPTWAAGREWSAGGTVWRENGFALPELRVPLYLGIWGSAFCATLSHYYKEIRPILKAGGMAGLDALMANKDDDLVKVHPIDPAVIPNFALGLRHRLPASCPESLHESTHLQLMDAGMANNLPIYPLLRPGRNVDIVIAFDASADIRGDNWIKVVDSYVQQRGIKGWPTGAGWPSKSDGAIAPVDHVDAAPLATTGTVGDAKVDTTDDTHVETDLGYCTIWAGTRKERPEFMDELSPNRVKSEADTRYLRSPEVGMAVIYFPFLANHKIPGVDPMKADFMSTWNFIYEPEEIDKVVALARANFEEGKEQTRRAIKAVWEGKKTKRLQMEEERKTFASAMRARKLSAAMGDHISGM